MRPHRWEAAAFRIGTAAALLHALDDAFLNRQPGVGLGQHWLAAAISLVVGVGAALGFPRLRPGFRAAISVVFGAFAIVNGALHAAHISVDGAAGSDYTGVVALAAGIALVLLGLAIPWIHRGRGAAATGRRWAYRVVAVLAGFVLVYAFVYPVSVAIVVTHKHRESVGDRPSAYQDVSFAAADGLDLSGWYRPSKNRAAVVIVHGGGGDRTGSVRHANLLARHGYGVLVYDSRGRGESEGTPVAMGWGWEKDVAGALRFLRARPDVDSDRIGGLGISTGGDVLFEVAADDRNLKAVVADGATAESFADYRELDGLDAAAPYWWTMYTAARVLSGTSPGEPLKELVAKIAPTPLLLVSTGGSLPVELDMNRIYAEAAREPVELWELPDVDHTAALQERPQEYERRVVGFFDRALLDRQMR
jgi:acetyl esterase/lipase